MLDRHAHTHQRTCFNQKMSAEHSFFGCLTHIDGAAHEGASLQSFLHDLVELFGSLLHLVELSDSTGEILHGLGGVSTLQGLVGAVQPGRRGAQMSKPALF